MLPPGCEKGDVMYYKRFSCTFYNDNKVSYGHEGEVLGPVDRHYSGTYVRMLFKGNEKGTDVLLEELSSGPPVSPTHAHLLCPLGERL